MLAIDQKAMDEHVRGTDRFHDLDDFSANLFRPGSDRVPPMIPENATKRCEVSLTRPTNITGVSIYTNTNAKINAHAEC